MIESILIIALIVWIFKTVAKQMWKDHKNNDDFMNNIGND